MKNDQTDINGDGVASDPADTSAPGEFLGLEKPYLPGHRNALQTPEEKIEWVRKMLAIDETDRIQYNNTGEVDTRWISGNYSTQIYLDFFGYGAEDIHEKYDTTLIARLNLPTYMATLSDPSAGTIDGIVMPNNYSLKHNHPNPFNPGTTIEYSFPRREHVSLEVYDILGRKLETLVDGVQDAGSHRVSFDASHYASGIYFYSLRGEEYAETRKIAVVK